MPPIKNDCVDSKLPKLLAEGRSQDEAVAIAYSMCSGKSLDYYDPDEMAAYMRTFSRVYADTQDPSKAAAAGEGAVQRLRNMLPVKAADGVIVEGWGILFSDPEHLDLQRTYFNKDTELLLERYANAPLWIDHENGGQPIGERSGYSVHENGVWIEHKLYADHPLYNDILAGIKASQFSYSTDSLGHYVQEGYDENDGHLKTWPASGCSITKTPAEPGLGRIRIKGDVAAGRSMSITNVDGLLLQGGSIVTPVETPPPGAVVVTDTSVKAQMAQDDTAPPTVQPQPTRSLAGKGLTAMDLEQMRAALVQALGLAPETTIEEILALLQQAVSGSAEEAPEAEMSAPADAQPVDMAAMRRAAGLADDASADAVKAEVQSIVDAIKAHLPQAVDETALAGVFEMARAAKAAAPNIRRNVGYQVSSKKSYGSVNVNANAPRPTLDSLVIAHLSGDRKGITAATKAQGTNENVLGGYLLSDTVIEGILEPLYNELILDKLGVERFTLNTETATVRKNLGGSQARWMGEHLPGQQSDVTFGVINFALKQVGAFNRISNRLLRRNSSFQSTIQDDMVRQLALAIDLAGLRGTGAKPAATGHTGAEPLGIRNLLPANQITSLGANGAAPSISSVNAAIARIKARNIVNSNSWGMAMSAREKQYVSGWTDTTGRPLMRERWDGAEFDQLLGIRIEESNQIPVNLTTGSSTDTSEIYLGDWSFAALAIGLDMEVAISEHFYFDSDDSLLRVLAQADFGVYYRDAFEILTGVRGVIS